MKKNFGLIFLFSLIVLANSKVTLSQIEASLNSCKSGYRENFGEYVSEFRVTKKLIYHYKIKIDESFDQNIKNKLISPILAERIVKSNSPAFTSSKSQNAVIEGGFVNENILHYYHVIYFVGASFNSIKKESVRYDACYWYFQARFSGKIYDNSHGRVHITGGQCNNDHSNPYTKGCNTFTDGPNSRTPLCCCPSREIGFFPQNPNEMNLSYNILGAYGVKLAIKDLLRQIQSDLSLEDDDDI